MRYIRQNEGWTTACLFLLFNAFAFLPNASADFVVYSNLNQASRVGFLPQGPSADVSGEIFTRLLADDITPIAGFAGQKVTQIKFTISNGGATSVLAEFNVRLYAADGTSGGPGTLLTAFTGAGGPTSWPAGLTQLVSVNTTSASIFLPAGTFWAGLTFSDGGGGATQAQLNNLGQDVVTPPTIGNSADVVFLTNAAGSFNGSNPAGTLGNFGGSPAANLGWEFSVAAIPEPSSFVFFLVVASAISTSLLLKSFQRGSSSSIPYKY